MIPSIREAAGRLTRVRTWAVEDAPSAFIELAWRAFFAERGRGLSIQAHFPWLAGGGHEDRLWGIETAGQPMAMLVVRRGSLDTAAGLQEFHAIGLVCTAPEYQRQGLATRLMREILDSVGADAPVLLWSSQHAFYERLGFELIDPTIVVEWEASSYNATAIPAMRSDWMSESLMSGMFGGLRGVPSFVTGVDCFRDHERHAALVVGHGRRTIVLEAKGAVEHVTAMITAMDGERLVINLPREGKLLGALKQQGTIVRLRHTDIAMWRRGSVDRTTIERADIPLLDRF
jgi:GNAT superfamily N-acetyltransferase